MRNGFDMNTIARWSIPFLAIALLYIAWSNYGWLGVAGASGLLVMWLLLYITRMMNVLQRTAQRPIGSVGSAVALNAKLKSGMNLLQVTTMTGALGEPLSPEGEQPERLRWTDDGQLAVVAESRTGGCLPGPFTAPPTTKPRLRMAGYPARNAISMRRASFPLQRTFS